MYLNDLSGNPPSLVFDTSSTALTTVAVIKNLTPGKTYLVTVTAVNAIGESAASTALTVNAGTQPSKIQSVTLMASTTTSLTVQWTPPASNGGLSLIKYRVYVDAGQTGTPTQTIDVLDTSINYQLVSPLATGQKVNFQISAFNANGESELSDIVTFYVATAPATPAAPTETQIFLPNYS